MKRNATKIIMVAVLGLIMNAFCIFDSSYAAGPSYDCGNHFLGLRAWYDGIVEVKSDGTCGDVPDINDFMSQKKISDKESAVRQYAWTIGLNIASMITGIAGYVAIGMVIWGGFLYMLAQGDVGKVAKGKKTIVNSVIGLVLIMTASIISGAIADIVSGADAKGNDFFLEIFNKAAFWSAIVAVIMIVYGGIQYITSAGSPDKVKKSKNAILYSVVGLLIVIFAATIVNFAMGAVGR